MYDYSWRQNTRLLSFLTKIFRPFLPFHSKSKEKQEKFVRIVAFGKWLHSFRSDCIGFIKRKLGTQSQRDPKSTRCMWPIAKFDLSHTNFTEILLDIEEYLYEAEECTKLSTHLSHTWNYCYCSVSIECCVIQAWLGLTTNLHFFIAQTQRVYPSSIRI